MQTFNKKQIAVAVGAALAAGAVSAAAPAVRTNGLLATNGALSQLQKQTLWNPATTATGVAGQAFGATLRFAASTTFVKFDTTNGNVVLTDTTATQGAVLFHVVDSNAAKHSINNLVTAQTATDAADTSTQATLDVTITPTATGAIRLQSGKLQYMDSASTNAAFATFRDVQVALAPTDSAFTAAGVIFTDEDSSGTFDTTATTAPDVRVAAATLASVAAGSTLVPTAIVYTRATNGKVDGAKIETFTPLASFAATNLVVKTRAVNSVTSDSAADTTFSAAADTTTASTSLYQVFWTAPQSVNWVAETTAADSSAYNAATFNTGIDSASVPFAFSTDTSVTATVYSAAFVESTGSNAPFATGAAGFPAPGTYFDGVAPTALSAQYDTANSELEIIFSEAIAVITGDTTTDGNKREIVENVSHKVGTTTTTLAAEAFNANATGGAAIGFSIGTPTDTTAAASTRLLLTGVPKAVLDTATAHTVEIGARITIAEPGDVNFSTAAALDTADGGLKAASFSNLDSGAMAFNAPSTNVARQSITGTGVSIGREVVAPDFDSAIGGVTAAAFLTSDNTKIQTIVVTFPGNVTVDTAATLTDQFVIELKDSIGTPYAASDTTGTGQSLFRFIPTAAQVTGGGTTKLTFTLPTTLEPANARNTWTIEYLGTNNVLKDANGQPYDDGTVNIALPFTAANTTVGLYTMDAKLPLVGAAPGSRLTTYVARWNDITAGDRYDTTGANSGFTFRSARVSNPNDRVATDILLEPFDNNWNIAGNGALDTLATAIAVELNKVGTTTKPSPITLYVQLIRNSDINKGSNDADADYLQARAYFSTNPADLDALGNQIQGEGSPTYVVQLDPVTGNISGRLTGRIDIAARKAVGNAGGLVFLDSNGNFVPFNVTLDSTTNGPVKSASVLDSASAGRIFIGAERKDNPRAFDGAFLLSVLEQQAAGVDTNTLVTSGDPGAKNFFPFVPSLDVRDPNRVGRTTLQAVPLAQLRTAALTNSTAWQLVGIGNLDRPLPINERDVPKGFISYSPTGNISLNSRWMGDTATADMALTMVGNNTGLSVESATGTRGGLAPKGNAAAFAFMNDVGTADKMSWLLKATSDASTPNGIGSATGLGLPAGWSLVAVPAGVTSTTNLPATVTMLLKVGAQRTTGANAGGSVSWVPGDPAQTLTQGEPVFVFARQAVAGR